MTEAQFNLLQQWVQAEALRVAAGYASEPSLTRADLLADRLAATARSFLVTQARIDDPSTVC